MGSQYKDGIVNTVPAPQFDISEDADALLYLGYLMDSFDLYGHHFSIRTLRRGEKLAIVHIANEWEGLAIGDALTNTTVAACLLSADNRPLSPPISKEEQYNPAVWIKRNLLIVHQWYDPVVEGIYTKYQALLVRQAQAFQDLQEK